jgi:hypothetical protein
MSPLMDCVCTSYVSHHEVKECHVPLPKNEQRFHPPKVAFHDVHPSKFIKLVLCDLVAYMASDVLREFLYAQVIKSTVPMWHRMRNERNTVPFHLSDR